MKSHTTRQFWNLFDRLPKNVRFQAMLAYHRWRVDPYHPARQFTRAGRAAPVYAVRIGRNWRALGLKKDKVITWCWIGAHCGYDKLLQEERNRSL